jgi:hypothetical protein
MVSTDEARKIQVQYIFLEETAKEQGEMILKELESGEDFGTLAMEYSKDKNYSMELSRGEHCKEFCDAAFALEIISNPFIADRELGAIQMEAYSAILNGEAISGVHYKYDRQVDAYLTQHNWD